MAKKRKKLVESEPVVERRIDRTPRRWGANGNLPWVRMQPRDDLDDTLDKHFGEEAFVLSEPPAEGFVLLGKLIKPTNDVLHVYRREA